jgi:hypothetical protein
VGRGAHSLFGDFGSDGSLQAMHLARCTGMDGDVGKGPMMGRAALFAGWGDCGLASLLLLAMMRQVAAELPIRSTLAIYPSLEG